MKTSAIFRSSINKLFVLIIAAALLTMSSCKKEDFGIPAKPEAESGSKYIIFKSDSAGVFGTLVDCSPKKYLYPNIPYLVQEGQTILFDRRDACPTIRFSVTADVGKYNYFSPDNQYHYIYTNEYILTVK